MTNASKSYPDEYKRIPIPENLRPNWSDNRPEVTWWKAGVDTALPSEPLPADIEAGIRAYLETGNPDTLLNELWLVRVSYLKWKRFRSFTS